MSCLFSTNKKRTIIIRPEAMQLAPEFSYLDQKEMMCVILAYDYHSIYRQFPEDERKRRAKAHVFGHEQDNFFSQAKVIKAVEKYRGLQYNPIRNQLMAFKKRLDYYNDIIGKDDVESKEIDNAINMSAKIRKIILEIEDELNKE